MRLKYIIVFTKIHNPVYINQDGGIPQRCIRNMSESVKKQYWSVFQRVLSNVVEFTIGDIQRTEKNVHVSYPSGKPSMLHLLCC